MISARLLALAAVGALFLTACHDAPRENPLDPVLTPPVELTVALDDTAGTATLTWTPYHGDQPFAEYRVLRNVSRSTVVDTLASLTVQGECAYLDTSLVPETAYEYRVAVVNTGGLEIDSARWSLPGYTLGDLHLLPIEVDSLAGTLIVRWQRYVGPDFAGYRVYRRPSGTAVDSLLGITTDQADTIWIDRDARHEVAYGYWVEAQVADRRLTSNREDGQLRLPGVRLVQAQFDSRTATAALEWTRYHGPHFSGYQLWRWSAEEVRTLVFATADSAVTAFVDGSLSGATVYGYQVVVQTDRDETVVSNEVRDGFHLQVAEWPLPVEVGGQVRLYWEDGRLTALVANPDQTRLVLYSPTGALLEDQLLLPVNPIGLFGYLPRPQSLSTVWISPDTRLLTLVDPSHERLAVVAFDGSGVPRWQEEPLFTGQIDRPSTPRDTVQGRWGLSVRVSESSLGQAGSVGGRASITGFGVSVDGAPQLTGQLFAERAQWEAFPSGIVAEGSYLTISTAGTGRSLPEKGVSRRYRGAWQQFSAMAAFLPVQGATSLLIGPDDLDYAWSHTLGLDVDTQQGVLVTRSYDGSRSSTQATRTFSLAFPVLAGAPYRLRLEADGSTVTVWAAHAYRWHRAAAANTQWVSIVDAGDAPLVIAEAQGVVLGAAFPDQELPTLEGSVSEARSWTRRQGGITTRWLGVCLAEQHKVKLAMAATGAGGELIWPQGAEMLLGHGVGPGPGELIFPLSFAPGSDGRFFVLDAGNARVQVFTRQAKYLTQWGGRGDSPGRFALGTNTRLEDLAGSIAVDDEGYVYVADPGNHRIQKFAP